MKESRTAPSGRDRDLLWARHDAEWREPAQVASQWEEAASVDAKLLQCTAHGDWWAILDATDATLLVTREYEHLVLSVCMLNETPTVSYMKLPHPSGMAVDLDRKIVHIASTRNPNQIFDLAPVTGLQPRLDLGLEESKSFAETHPLVPVRSRFLPGCTYIHDLALINGALHANSVGQNAIVRVGENGHAERVWWPRCIETANGPIFGRNHLQLNSIAAGEDLAHSYFSASADKISARRPGHKNFPVDRRGVIFSGATREPIARGLTRPHSARLFDGRVWVDNSGYGELGVADDGKFVPVARMPGWTRGLAFHGDIAFVGTSRVIPRFSQYAPGIKIDESVCGLHAVDSRSGRILGSLLWPYGNQVFAIELVPRHVSAGFPFQARVGRTGTSTKQLFYAFKVEHSQKDNSL